MEPGFVVLIIAVVGALIAYAIYSSAKRRKELAAWAQANGLSFSRDKVRDMDDRYPEFKCLRRGRSRFAFNVMAGELQGLPVTAFDYHYVTGSGKNQRLRTLSRDVSYLRILAGQFRWPVGYHVEDSRLGWNCGGRPGRQTGVDQYHQRPGEGRCRTIHPVG